MFLTRSSSLTIRSGKSIRWGLDTQYGGWACQFRCHNPHHPMLNNEQRRSNQANLNSFVRQWPGSQMAVRFLFPLIPWLGGLKLSTTVYTAVSIMSGQKTRSLLSYRNGPLTPHVSFYWGATEILLDPTEHEDPSTRVRCQVIARNRY